MRLLVLISIFAFSLSSQANVCESALASYSTAMHELVQTQLKFDQMRIEGTTSDAALRLMNKQIESAKLKLITILGKEDFDSEFTKALKQQSGITTEQNITRQVVRENKLIEETTLGRWAQLHVLQEFKEDAQIFLTPDSRYILAKSYKKAVVFDLETGRKVSELESPTTFVSLAANLSHDGHFFAAATEDGEIKIWNIETGDQTQLLKIVDKPKRIQKVYFSPDGRYIITITDEKHSIKVWDVNTGELYLEFKPAIKDKSPIVSISPDSRYILVSSRGLVISTLKSSIEVIDLETRKKAFQVPSPSSNIREVSFLLDSRHIITSFSNDQGYFIWDLEKPMPKSRFSFSKIEEPSLGVQFGADFKTEDAIITPDQKRMILRSKKTFVVLDIEDYKTLDKRKKRFSVERKSGVSVNLFAVSPNSQTMAFLGGRDEIEMWSLSSGVLDEVLTPGEATSNIRFSSNGRYVVTVHANGKVIIWSKDSKIEAE